MPKPLPPIPPIEYDAELQNLLSQADRALGRLDGVTTVFPNPDLFVAMYVRHEAVLSSQIEGTQSTLRDVLEYEADAASRGNSTDAAEVVNYVQAMNYGLKRLDDLPLSLRLIREIHGKLLAGVRGTEKTPGHFRTSQNWIGPEGCNLATAAFVPPPVNELLPALGQLESFLHDESLPLLVHCGLAHAQFETIHPFLDGNGRVGRLLITFLLCQRRALQRPLLYLSLYLKAHRTEYYDRLTAIRSAGNWEGWLKFFLRGIFEVSQSAFATARAILSLRELHRQMIADRLGQQAGDGQRLLDALFQQPIVSVGMVVNQLGRSYATANKVVLKLVELGLLQPTSAARRNRIYRYEPYLNVFENLALPSPAEEADGKVHRTRSGVRKKRTTT